MDNTISTELWLFDALTHKGTDTSSVCVCVCVRVCVREKAECGRGISFRTFTILFSFLFSDPGLTQSTTTDAINTKSFEQHTALALDLNCWIFWIRDHIPGSDISKYKNGNFARDSLPIGVKKKRRTKSAFPFLVRTTSDTSSRRRAKLWSLILKTYYFIIIIHAAVLKF